MKHVQVPPLHHEQVSAAYEQNVLNHEAPEQTSPYLQHVIGTGSLAVHDLISTSAQLSLERAEHASTKVKLDESLEEVERLRPFEEEVENQKSEARLAKERSVAKDRDIDRLQWMSSTDSLTGLLTFDAFELLVDSELAEQRQRVSEGHPELRNLFNVIDIDVLTDLNRVLNHLGANNQVFKPLGQILFDIAKKYGGYAGRFGTRSDEFGLAIFGVTPLLRQKITKDLRTRVRALTLSKPVAGKSYPGISVGQADFWSLGGFDEAIVRADTAALIAKDIPGKDQTVYFNDLNTTSPEISEKMDQARRQLADEKREKKSLGMKTSEEIDAAIERNRSLLEAIKMARQRNISNRYDDRRSSARN